MYKKYYRAGELFCTMVLYAVKILLGKTILLTSFVFIFWKYANNIEVLEIMRPLPLQILNKKYNKRIYIPWILFDEDAI